MQKEGYPLSEEMDQFLDQKLSLIHISCAGGGGKPPPYRLLLNEKTKKKEQAS